MFPELDLETITTVLDANGGDVSRTAEMFLPTNVMGEVSEEEKRPGSAASVDIAVVEDLSKVLKWAESDDMGMQVQAARCLCDLSMHPPHQRLIVRHGGIERLVAMLESPLDEIRTLVCAALANLALDDANQIGIMQGLPSVAALLRLLEKDAPSELQMHAARAVANLVYLNEGNERAFVDHGALPPLIELCVDDASAPTQVEALAAIANLARNAYNQQAMMEVGAHSVVVRILRSGVGSASQQQATRVIANLSMHKASQLPIAHAHALPPLILVTNIGAPPAQRLACMALANLAANDDLQLQIVQDGALDPLFALLRGTDKDAQKHAARCLANLSENDWNKKKIIQQGGLKQFLSMARSECVELQLLAAKCLGNLASVHGTASSW